MAYPSTTFNWIDETGVQIDIAENPLMPLGLACFSADRGPEKIQRVYGEDFFKLFGWEPSFIKHGQPLVQAANWITNAGALLVKRVVASDAMLANLCVVAKLKGEAIQKVNSDNEPLYIDAVSGEETTEAYGNEPIMTNTATISYETMSIEGIKTLKDAVDAMRGVAVTEGDELVYPLFVVTDNGRGASTKRFNIVPDYSMSKSVGFMMYYLNFIGTDKDSEHIRFCADEFKIYANTSMDFKERAKDMLQIQGSTVDDYLTEFVEKIAEFTGVSYDELIANDVLFGADRRGRYLDYIKVAEGSVELDRPQGFLLMNGSNGSFGNKPFGTEEYTKQMVEFFNGTFDDSIYDQDMWQVDVCLDANYPAEVKAAIGELVAWRQDFFYFRDYGLDVVNFDQAMFKSYDASKSRFIADYPQTVEIIDPFARKRDTVTFPYLLSSRLIPHLNSFRNAPVCGIKYEFTFPEVLDETKINFIPKHTPKSGNQKEAMKDAHINYASMIDGVLTLETQVTSQEANTQYSKISNILAVQDMIHNIRVRCPRMRYEFIDKDDMNTYQKKVEDIIRNYSDNFASLEFIYTQDDMMVANNIFAASIKVRFRNYVEAEIFDIYAVN